MLRCTARCLSRFPCSNCQEIAPVVNVIHNGEKIGEVRQEGGSPFHYAAYLQGGGIGFDVRLPDPYPSAHAACVAIRNAHRPEPDRGELGGEG
jgi:hypothetical protein